MPHKLLLADDSVTIQRVIELTFADEDVQLTAVGNGQLAIDRITADPPDIVLADVGMPEKDGYEVAAFIKHNPRLAHIPVLLLTGAFEPVDEERARAAGCDGVLAKPFEPQMVITRVKELLADAARAAASPRAVPPGLAAALALPAPPRNVVEPEAGTPPPLPATVTMSTDEMLAQLDALVPSAEPPGVEPADSDLTRAGEALGADSLQIRRRPTMAVPEFGVPPIEPPPDLPAAPPSAPAALDDYFDRLDSAFGQLSQASRPPLERAPVEDEPSLEPVVDLAYDLPAPMPASPAADGLGAPFDFPAEPQARQADGEIGAPAPAFAQAFSALLAAEGGEGGAAPMAPLFGGGVPAPAVDENALADRITRAVLDRLSDRIVRETVTDIVSRTAERLVREEIARLKASLP